MERQLATIRRITEIKPIEGADKIELAVVDGWQAVVKKDEYQPDTLIVYVEIDAWMPHTLAPFLTKSGHYPKVYQLVEGQRLRTAKLRGALSQGLILSIEHCISVCGCWSTLDEGTDVSEWLGILKWEKEIPACLAGTMKGNFPSILRKTDQERIQNLTKQFESFKQDTWEVTEKLDGSSCTFFLDSEGVFNVCSRNINLKEDEGNSFWQAARKYNVEELMRKGDLINFAIQGELIGPGIQGNQYERKELEFYIFDMFDADQGKYLPPYDRRLILTIFLDGMLHVPVLQENWFIPEDATVDSLLMDAEGTSTLNDSTREGKVYKRNLANNQGEVESFKCISNSWLMKYE